jgi:hypothetical protein
MHSKTGNRGTRSIGRQYLRSEEQPILQRNGTDRKVQILTMTMTMMMMMMMVVVVLVLVLVYFDPYVLDRGLQIFRLASIYSLNLICS